MNTDSTDVISTPNDPTKTSGQVPTPAQRPVTTPRYETQVEYDACDVHDEHARVDQQPLPQSGQSARPLPRNETAAIKCLYLEGALGDEVQSPC